MRYFIGKLVTLTATVLLVSILTFFVFQVLPGDPAEIVLGLDAEKQQIEALRKEMGLDRPPVIRYVDWIKGVWTGDLGISLRYQRPVAELMRERLPVTFSLAVLSLGMTVLFGLPLGIFIVNRDGKFSSFAVSVWTQLGIAVPSFWFAFILILVFGVWLKLFPTYGYTDWGENPREAFRSLFLPSLALAIPNIAVVIRYLRNTLLDQNRMDYVRTARSKGLDERHILYRHVLRNALIPVITILGLLVADILGGSIVIENVFSLPGIGSLLVTSIHTRDLPLIQSIVLYIALLVVFMNFAVDLLYKWIDPRIRLGR